MVISENIYNNYEVVVKLDIKEALKAYNRIGSRQPLDSYLELNPSKVNNGNNIRLYNLYQSQNETEYTI